MMSDRTPTTDVIRDACTFPRERLGEPRPIKPEAFDRWLTQQRAEAWDEGHRDGLQTAARVYDRANRTNDTTGDPR